MRGCCPSRTRIASDGYCPYEDQSRQMARSARAVRCRDGGEHALTALQSSGPQKSVRHFRTSAQYRRTGFHKSVTCPKWVIGTRLASDARYDRLSWVLKTSGDQDFFDLKEP